VKVVLVFGRDGESAATDMPDAEASAAIVRRVTTLGDVNVNIE
jgi:hypothetical protein